ncbi:MAG: hypothetical protein K5924_05760 [Chloroflexi bacterium]|nr:hypothetical protein [Chloroflexota bacterium]
MLLARAAAGRTFLLPSVDEVVLAVCRLPQDFYAAKNSAVGDLVRSSGYPAIRSQLTVERLAACLRSHPDWVAQWLDWSAGNRSSPSWYVIEADQGGFHLGFYDGQRSEPPAVITDQAMAVAEFIHRYLQHISPR